MQVFRIFITQIIFFTLGFSACSSSKTSPDEAVQEKNSSAIEKQEDAYNLGMDLELTKPGKSPVNGASPQKDTSKSAPVLKAQRIVPLGIGNDGFPKVNRYYKDVKGVSTLEKAEIDFNADGRVDMIEWYDASGNFIEKEAVDFQSSGKLSVTSYYRNVFGSPPEMIKQEIDARLEGRPSVWKHFKNKQLVRREIDRKGLGQPDLWEYYENNRLIKVDSDENGDGNPDSKPNFPQVVKPQKPESTLKAQPKIR